MDYAAILAHMVNLYIFVALVCLIAPVQVAAMLYLYSVTLTDSPFIPTPQARVATILKALQLQPGDVFYDLGSGDGRFVLAAARSQPKARCVGVDKAFVAHLAAMFRLWRHGWPTNATLINKDFREVHLAQATHIYCYLYPKIITFIEQKVLKECKPGTRVLCCDFAFSTLTPQKTIELVEGKGLARKLYIYEL